MSSKVEGYNTFSSVHNFFFHPLHAKKELKIRALLSLITNIFLTAITGGLWLVPFSIVNRLDHKKIKEGSKSNSEKVQNATSNVFPGQNRSNVYTDPVKDETTQPKPKSEEPQPEPTKDEKKPAASDEVPVKVELAQPESRDEKAQPEPAKGEKKLPVAGNEVPVVEEEITQPKSENNEAQPESVKDEPKQPQPRNEETQPELVEEETKEQPEPVKEEPKQPQTRNDEAQDEPLKNETEQPAARNEVPVEEETTQPRSENNDAQPEPVKEEPRKPQPSNEETQPEPLKNETEQPIPMNRVVELSIDANLDDVAALKLVTEHPNLFQTLPISLQGNKNFVLKAVEANASVFEFATSFQEDPDVCRKALVGENSIKLLKLVKNKELIKGLVSYHDLMVEHISDEFRKDREVIYSGVTGKYGKYYTGALNYAHEDVKNDEEFVLGAVQINALNFIRAGEKLRTDVEFVKKAIKANPGVAELLESGNPTLLSQHYRSLYSIP